MAEQLCVSTPQQKAPDTTCHGQRFNATLASVQDECGEAILPTALATTCAHESCWVIDEGLMQTASPNEAMLNQDGIAWVSTTLSYLPGEQVRTALYSYHPWLCIHSALRGCLFLSGPPPRAPASERAPLRCQVLR